MKQFDFSLNKEAIELIKKEKKKYENSRSILIESLKIIQKYHGWINDQAIHILSHILEIPVSEIEGVATFYSQIYRQPVGKNIIKYCDSSVCYINGYKNNELEIKKLLKISIGETTIDNKFTLLNTCCLGMCDKGPSMMINDDTYCNIQPNNIKKILEKYK